MDKSYLIIACSIFRNELERLMEERLPDVEVFYLDSMLHMHPEKLEELMNSILPKHKDKKVILLYGDCYSRIMESETPNLQKVDGINCCEIFLGEKRYRKLRSEGAFILLPEWLNRWREVFRDELGFKDPRIAKKFMNEFHTRLVYLDTGMCEIPVDKLNELSSFTGLDYRIEPCSGENLLSEIEKTRKNLTDD